MHDELLSHKALATQSLPIINDFMALMLDKNLKNTFWNIFGDIQLNEKDFLLHELDISDLAFYMGNEYLLQHGSLEEIDLDLARNLFFNYMLLTYFNTTALGSINKLNLEWSNHQPLIKQFQSQIIAKYLNKFQPKNWKLSKLMSLWKLTNILNNY